MSTPGSKAGFSAASGLPAGPLARRGQVRRSGAPARRSTGAGNVAVRANRAGAGREPAAGRVTSLIGAAAPAVLDAGELRDTPVGYTLTRVYLVDGLWMVRMRLSYRRDVPAASFGEANLVAVGRREPRLMRLDARAVEIQALPSLGWHRADGSPAPRLAMICDALAAKAADRLRTTRARQLRTTTGPRPTTGFAQPLGGASRLQNAKRVLSEPEASAPEQVLVVTIGLPGSGKTGRAKAWVAQDPGRRARVGRDPLRAEVHCSPQPSLGSLELVVTALQQQMISVLLAAGMSVVVDDTNLSRQRIQAWQRFADQAGVRLEVWDLTDRSLEDCISGDQQRAAAGGRLVGETAIRAMAAAAGLNPQHPQSSQPPRQTQPHGAAGAVTANDSRRQGI